MSDAIVIVAAIVTTLVALDFSAFRSGVDSRDEIDDDRHGQLPA